MNLSHHANLIIGNAQTREQLILLLEKEYQITAPGNPDFYIRNYEVMTIDDAREIKSLHSSRPVSDSKMIFVLTMNSVTVEAQNALLKLLEEPAEYAVFFLIIPGAHLLLPTVKSRLSVMDYKGMNNRDTTVDCSEAEIFLKASTTKRLEIVKKLVDEISKEKKTKQDAIDFLDAIQSIFYLTHKPSIDTLASYQAIERARNYLNDRAPSVKMLLEYVALNV
jgi:DNA polymerase III delta prime subunit